MSMKIVVLKTTGLVAENNEAEVPEVHALAQELVNEQMKGIIAPVTRQPEEMTRPVQGTVTTLNASNHPRADYSATSGGAVHQHDIYA